VKTVTTAMAAHLASSCTTLCSCWKVTRVDGAVLGFTDHDVELVIEGVTYLETSGYFRSAITNAATISGSALEVKGFLDDDSISETDLIHGLYDYADVEVFMVNWADLSQGKVRLRFGKFGEVTRWPSGMFVVELRGLMQLFQQTVGEIFTPECRADLGDARCKLTLLTDIRKSNAVVGTGSRVVTTATASTQNIALAAAQRQLRIPRGCDARGLGVFERGRDELRHLQAFRRDLHLHPHGARWLCARTGSVRQYHVEPKPEAGDSGSKWRFSYKFKQHSAHWQTRVKFDFPQRRL
jgi:hypothetical protein